MNRNRFILAVTFGFIFLVLIVFALGGLKKEREVRYTIEKLSIPGSTSSEGRGINDFGEVVGDAWVSAGTRGCFVWSPGKNAKEILADAEGNPACWKINNRGQVLGRMEGKDRKPMYHFLWSAEEGMRKLDSGGDGGHYVRDLNDLGQTVGYCVPAGKVHRAAIWNTSGEVAELSVGPRSTAEAVDNHGSVFGACSKGLFIQRSEGSVSYYGYDEMSHDEKNESQELAVRDVNDREHVVGDSYDSSAQVIREECRAFLWSATDGLVHLDTWHGYISCAKSINNSGQIVGYTTLPAGSGPPKLLRDLAQVLREAMGRDPIYWSHWQGSRAILWEGGEKLDLNDLIRSDTEWASLNVANDINERGQVVGYGIHRKTRIGFMTGFVLTPVGEGNDGEE